MKSKQRSFEDSQRLRRTREGVFFCVFGFSVVSGRAGGEQCGGSVG
jgi:hypothetical protein